MAEVRLLSAVKKGSRGTPGSSAVERGFEVKIETRPILYAYRAAIVWTPDAWRNVEYTDCKLANTTPDTDIWSASISYIAAAETTFFYALVAAAVDGISWDNNNGWNYLI